MSKNVWNPSAQKTVIQINSTLNALQEKALCITYNPVPPIDDTQHCCQITWHSHVPDRSNSGKSFIKLAQYHHILETNSYHCLLFDGSLIRVNFKFEDDFLLTQNLLWWPAPYDYEDLLQDFAPIDILKNFYIDDTWHQNIRMRSPIRIDFDSTNNTKNHPHSHLHIQNAETRINTVYPVCFNRFIDFIFKNFYPQYIFQISQSDFINYKIHNLYDENYTSSKIII